LAQRLGRLVRRGNMNSLTLQPLDVGEPQTEIDDLKLSAVGVATRATAQRSENTESADVEIVKHQEGDVMRRAQFLDQLTGCRDAHAFRRHDAEVVSFGEMRLLEERTESFLF